MYRDKNKISVKQLSHRIPLKFKTKKNSIKEKTNKNQIDFYNVIERLHNTQYFPSLIISVLMLIIWGKEICAKKKSEFKLSLQYDYSS